MSKHFNVFIIGCKGDGKTTLAANISKYSESQGQGEAKSYAEINNPPEAKVKGVIIRYFEIQLKTPRMHYNFIDCPNYSDHVKTILCKKVNGLILVVSNDKHDLNQLKKHIELATALKIPIVSVYISQINEEYSELSEEFMYEISKMIPDNILSYDAFYTDFKTFIEELDGNIPRIEPVSNKDFLMPIQSVSSIIGRGTVVNGKIESGVVKAGESMVLIDREQNLSFVITGITVSEKVLDKGEEGQNVGLLLRGISKRTAEKGIVLAKRGSASYTKFEALIYAFSKEEEGRQQAFFHGYSPQFYFYNTHHIDGNVKLLNNRELVLPGDIVSIEVELKYAMFIALGTKFLICEDGKTIGLGKVSRLTS